ncbi:hypothetical protein N657DRAFT_681630 [Parathielavia appendiculata]|uniref:Endonuclease/exonuclease/phosphatase domain-containing protein n=1 Tax=Parathielavia appendiculata TaxID=2587402 RepID=A0AAN6Z278_9PEZI|nr:hypothetical protein N657DRAFT_681630 [Parathielavia appendiculata]
MSGLIRRLVPGKTEYFTFRDGQWRPVEAHGTTILVPRSDGLLPITSVARQHYARTVMSATPSSSTSPSPVRRTHCAVTTHLESPRAVPPKRPVQLAAAAAHLRQEYAGVLAGDLNATEKFGRNAACRRFGMDVVVEEEEEEEADRESMEEWDLEKPWVTDHLGFKAEFVVEVGEAVGESRGGVRGGF